ncbi:MAG: 1-phosphofructokinase family hexose kinase [Pseudolabrys sp.]|nr:1-phosphofructokinase family hexose kinase [Pseudolabrys sp.]MDP2296159.1 1-phosphofructokinase family hexose kinase [Pseudolabrys sp.]
MPDIVTLTINPAVDIFVNVDHVEPTAKLRCSSPKRDPGGGGINVARVAHRLGSNVAAIYPVGGAIGKLLQRLVEREGIDSIVTPSHVETRENFTAYETDSGNQFRFVLPGSALHRAEWEACLERLVSLRDRPKFVVASGSIPPGVPDDFFAQVVKAAKKMGAQTVVDTSGASLAAVLDEGVTLFKPNLNELSQLTGAKLESDAACVAACRKLIVSGRAEAVALTLGDKGALLVTVKRVWKAQPLDIEVASAVGAGDSFLGGMVSALAAGLPIEEAFRTGIAAATAAVMSPGTELCSEEDVKRLLPRVEIREVVEA